METVQKEFSSTGGRIERTLTVRANGGSVTVEASSDGVDWVLTDTKSVDGGWILFQGKALIRITPNGGAEYEFV